MSFREFMMHKAVKLSLAGAGALVSLFIIALVVLSTVIDLNDYKDRISTIVFDNTGRTLVFDGELDLLVFPRFGVELGGLSLSNAEGFGPEPMIKVSSASVTVLTTLTTGLLSVVPVSHQISRPSKVTPTSTVLLSCLFIPPPCVSVIQLIFPDRCLQV